MHCIRDRRGSSVLPAVWIIGAIFGISVSIGLLRGGISGGNFFTHASRAASKTLADVFHRAETKPAFEINLAENAPASRLPLNGGVERIGAKPEKNSPGVPRVSQEISQKQEALSIYSIAPQAKKGIIAPEPAPSGTAEVKNNSGAKNIGAAQEIAAAPACDFASGKIPNHKILVNEIAWMGNASSVSDEWIEVRNNSGADISLSGWQIKNQDESLKINFSGSDTISSGGLYLLERTDDAAVPNVRADKIYVGALSNGGEWIRIFDKNCGLVDDVNASDGWPGGDKAVKKTLERNVFDFEWHTSAEPGGTPRAKNLETIFVAADAPPQAFGGNSEAAAPAASPQITSSTSVAPTSSPQTAGGVFITEVMVGKDGASDYEFVEFFNSGTAAVDLTGWSVKKRSLTGNESTLLATSRPEGFQGKSILPGRHFLAANQAGYTGSVVPDGTWATSNTLAYANNTVILYNGNGQKIDEVSWTEIPKDQSYERDPASGAVFIVEVNPNPQNSSN